MNLMAPKSDFDVWKLYQITGLLLGVTAVLQQNVTAKSIEAFENLPLNPSSFSTERPETTAPPTSSSSTWSEFKTLDWEFNPDELVTFIDSSSSIEYGFGTRDKYNGFRLAIHLQTCDFEEDEYIEIRDANRANLVGTWECKKKPNFYSNQHSLINDVSLKHSGDKYVTVQHFLDDLDELWIALKNNGTGRVQSTDRNKSKATIVVNVYQDKPSSNSCDQEFFDCFQPLCPEKCCSDVNGGGNKNSGLFARYFSRGNGKSRCIPKTLKCNNHPNCGMKTNSDETNQVCHSELHCQCQTVCLTWNYVLTSLAIAVLFIITPTAIVFALFHRRNVALERARLIRLAHARMADMRGEYTMESPITDVPPTYDEVFDTKEPPPCFCQAMAMEMGVDVVQLQQTNNGGSAETESREQHNDGVIIGVQNLGFQCSCNNVNPASLEPPPTYLDVSGNTSDEIDSGFSNISSTNLSRNENISDVNNTGESET